MDDDDEMGRTSFKRKYRCRCRPDFADYPVPVPVAYHPMTHTVSTTYTPLCCLRLPRVYIVSFLHSLNRQSSSSSSDLHRIDNRASGWDIKYGSYDSPESRMSYVVNKETADIEQKS